MNTHVRIDHDGDGRPLADKRATAEPAVELIRAEAARLAAIDHPGVVSFVELREEPDGPHLLTAYVGPRSLATLGPVTVERAAGLVADLATTVADLHQQGVVHGRIRPDHVLVAGDRTVLCSPAPDPTGLAPADDVLGVGHCLQALLEPDLDEEPIPDRRPWRRTPWLGYRHRALLTLADQATDDEPGRRPGARAMAEAIRSAACPPIEDPSTRRGALLVVRDLVDLAAIRLRWRPAGASATTGPVPGRRRLATLIGATGVAVAALGGVGLLTSLGPGATAPPAASASVTEAPPPCPGPAPTRATGQTADLDGDGCTEAVRRGPGWLEVDGRRYRVGRPGNAIVLADEDGDGRDTVLLLQRGTGQVWRFPHWDPEATVTAEPVVGVTGAIDLLVRPAPTGDQVVVRRRDGSELAVPS